jgi:hypothetical protein
MLLVVLSSARATTPEDEYLKIFDQIQQADKLASNGQTNTALAKYREAQYALFAYRKAHPDSLVSTIKFRLGYVAERIGALTTTPAGSPPALTGAPGTNAAADTSATQKVNLLEAGSEPRKVLRIHPEPGGKQTITLTTKTDTEVMVPGMPSQATKVPALKLTMSATVKSISAEGDITYDFVFDDAAFADEPDAMPQLAELMKPVLATLKGLLGTGTMTSRGNQTVQIHPPAGTDPLTSQTIEQLNQSFAGLGFALPEEPVGPGAKWQTRTPFKSQGMTIEQTITSQLISVDGDRVNVQGAVTQQAASQKIKNPAMPSLVLELTKMAGTGTLEFTFELTQLYPSELTGDSHADLTVEMDAAGQKQSMSMTTTSKVHLQAK